jgi:hypothetical protein
MWVMQNSFLFFKFFLCSLSLLTVLGCTRPNGSGESSSLSLNIPAGEQSSQETVEILSHVTINISGPGIAKPILINWDNNCYPCTPTQMVQNQKTAFNIEVPSGAERLIQVVAVYMDQNSKMSLYYGDLTKNLVALTETAPVLLNKLTTNNEFSGTIAGRYLTGENIGPTGVLTMKFKPEGKPSLVIKETTIINGWFNTFALSGLPFIYELPSGDLLFDQPVSLNAPVFNASPQIVRTFVPRHRRQDYGPNGTTELRVAEPFGTVFGYFGNSQFTQTKKVCKETSYTFLNFKRASGEAASMTLSSETPPSDLFNGNLTQVFQQGGLDQTESTCTLTATNAYHAILPFKVSQMDDRGRDAAIPFKVPFALSLEALQSDEWIRIFDNDFSSGAGVHSGRLLPGISSIIAKMKMFKATGEQFENSHDETPDCNQIKSTSSNYVLMGEAIVQNEGQFVLNGNLTPPALESPMGFVACFEGTATANAFASLLKIGTSFYRWDFMDYQSGGGGPGPATKLAFGPRDAVSQGACITVDVYRADQNNQESMQGSTGELVVDLSTVPVAGSPTGVFYPVASFCTAGSEITQVTIPENQTRSLVKFKPSVSAPSTTLLTAATTSLAQGELNLPVRSSSQMSELRLKATPFLSNFSNVDGCREFKFMGFNSMSDPRPISSVATTIPVSKYGGISLYSNGSCSTALSIAGVSVAASVSYSNPFFVKMNDLGPAGLSASNFIVDGISFKAGTGFEVVPEAEATKFNVAIVAASVGKNYSNNCIGVAVSAVNDLNSAIQIPAQNVQLQTEGYVGGTLKFYSNDSCTSHLGDNQTTLNFSGSESSKTVYVKMATIYNVFINLAAWAQGEGASLGGFGTIEIKPVYLSLRLPSDATQIADDECVGVEAKRCSDPACNNMIPNLSGTGSEVYVFFSNEFLDAKNLGHVGLYQNNSCTTAASFVSGNPNQYFVGTILNYGVTSTTELYIKNSSGGNSYNFTATPMIQIPWATTNSFSFSLQ